MKTNKEFQGNKGFTGLQVKKMVNVRGGNQESIYNLEILQDEQLMQIKGGDEVPGTVRDNDID